MLKTVYLDLDGVIYDFIGHLAYMDGYSYCGNWFAMIEKSEYSYQEYIKMTMDKYHLDGLYRDGAMLSDGMKLLADLIECRKKYGFELIILSAMGNTDNRLNDESLQAIKRDKINWLKNTLLGYKGIYYLVDDVIIVNSSHDKILYAKDDSILIDDHRGTQKTFMQNGKNFILYNNYIEAMTEFQLYL